MSSLTSYGAMLKEAYASDTLFLRADGTWTPHPPGAAQPVPPPAEPEPVAVAEPEPPPAVEEPVLIEAPEPKPEYRIQRRRREQVASLLAAMDRPIPMERLK